MNMYTYQHKTQNTHKLILCELSNMWVYLFVFVLFVYVWFVCFVFLENIVLLLFLACVFLFSFYEVVLHKYIITFGSYNIFPFENNIHRR